MDVTSIAGSLSLAQLGQTQQSLSTDMVKQAAAQQDKVANILAQTTQQAAQPGAPKSDSNFNFSIFA